MRAMRTTMAMVIAVVVAACSGSESESGAERGFVAESLAALPAAAWYDIDSLEPKQGLAVWMLDLDRAASDNELPAPADEPDGDAALARFVDVTIEPPVADGGTGARPLESVGVTRLDLVRQFPASRAWIEWRDTESIIGFSPLAIRTLVVATNGGLDLAVARGDLPLSPSLHERGDGVVSLADEPTADIEQTVPDNVVSHFWNVNAAHRDPSDDTSPLGISTSAAMVEAWAAGDDALLDRNEFGELARILDDAEVTSARLYVGDPIEFPNENITADVADVFEAAPMVTEPYVAIGLGVSVIDGRALVALVYHFGDDQAAERAATEVESVWTGDAALRGELRPVEEFAVVRSVERRDGSVVVSMTPLDGRTTADIDQLVAQSSVLLRRVD